MPAYLRTLLWLAVLIIPGGLLLLPLVVVDAGRLLRTPGKKPEVIGGRRLDTASASHQA